VTPHHFSGGQSLVPTIPTGSRKVEKGAFLNANFVQRRIESAQKLFAESGSDSASKFYLVAFVEDHQQSAKILSRPLRLGVATNDEFLLLMEFNLDPSSGAPSGLIPGTGALTNQTFEPKFASPFQKLWNVFCEGDRISDYTRRLFQQFFQFCLSIIQFGRTTAKKHLSLKPRYGGSSSSEIY
jgi:hypothetical protein